MKRINEEQLTQLDALYRNGQFNGAGVPEWSMVTEADGVRMIAEAENVKPNTYEPASEIFMKDLGERILDGKLTMEENMFRFMMQDQAKEILWLQRSSNKGREPVLTKSQSRRIKALIGKGFLKHRSNGEISSLSFDEAEKLIDEGNNNALNEQ